MRRPVFEFRGTKRYKPTRLLGVGGMGAVYEAEDTDTGGRVAVKVMLNHDPRQLLRFKQEFRVIAELHHKNLVRLFDLCLEEEQFFFTMELLTGKTLLDVFDYEDKREEKTKDEKHGAALKENANPEEDSNKNSDSSPCDLPLFLKVFSQILDALEFLHSQGIIHRDLKPSNILVTHDNKLSESLRVVLLDFGLTQDANKLSISEDGTAVGTLAYMSPEQCKGEVATPASDLYALGCMMFQLLTGQMAFPGSAVGVIQARLERQPPRVERRVSGVPKEICDTCYALLSRDPKARPSIQEIRRGLGLVETPKQSTLQPIDGEIQLIGRTAETETLNALLSKASGGSLTFALMEGVSGIGKSKLASVIIESAKQKNFLCLRGRCYERERLPFVAFDRAIDALVLHMSKWPKERITPFMEYLFALYPVFPVVEVLFSKRQKLPSSEGIAPPERAQRAFEGFCQLLTQIQQTQPLLFVLDDLQWADEESLRLLEALLTRCQGRLMILGLSRPEGECARKLATLTERTGGTQIRLEGLSAQEVELLSRAISGAEFTSEISDSIARQAEGNPFLALRMASYLAGIPPEERSSKIESAKNAWFQSTLASLSPRAEQVLSVAAAAGGDIERGALHHASGLSAEEFDLAIGELSSSRLCKSSLSTGELQLRYLDIYHDKIREAAYERLEPERRRQIHQSLATTLESTSATHDTEALLRHWTEAGNPQKQRDLALKAAEEAVEKLALHRAVQLLRLVIDLTNEAQELSALWERIGSLSEYNGQFIAAIEAYQKALLFWEETPENDERKVPALLRLRGRVGENLTATGKINEAVSYYEKGLALLGLPLRRSLGKHILVLLWLRFCLFLNSIFTRQTKATPLEVEKAHFLDLLIRFSTPMWTLTTAEAGMRCDLLSHTLDDKRILQRSLATKGIIPVFVGSASEKEVMRAQKSLDASEQLAITHNIPLGTELVKFNRGVLSILTQPEQAKRDIQESLEGYKRRGVADFFDGTIASTLNILILTFIDEHEEAIKVCTADIERPHPNFYHISYAVYVRLIMLARLGRTEEAQKDLARLEELVSHVPLSNRSISVIIARGAVYNSLSRFQESFEELEKKEPMVKSIGLHISKMSWSTWCGISLAAALGLLQNKKLTDAQRSRALAQATWLSRSGVLGHKSLGYRGLALLLRETKPEASKQALQAALSQPAFNPYYRWLCLDTAKDFGVATKEQEREALEITQKGHAHTVS